MLYSQIGKPFLYIFLFQPYFMQLPKQLQKITPNTSTMACPIRNFVIKKLECFQGLLVPS